MPTVKPIPIKTKGLIWYKALHVWLITSRKWELTKDWSYIFKNNTIVIRKGFVFNGVSVPRFFWWLLSPVGILFIAALIHDYGYRKGTVNRKYWDKLFLLVNREVNGFYYLNLIPYFFIRIFGIIPWYKYRWQK